MLLLQVPPLVASVKLIMEPTQTLVGPPMAAGNALTVTGAVVKQLVPDIV